MRLERILSTLDDNKIRATADAVADLVDVSIDELEALLRADPDRAAWVVSPGTLCPVIANSSVHAPSVAKNPVVIKDAMRLRTLVIATELTATEMSASTRVR